MISWACSTQFSQICPSCPAIRIFTSSLLRPQKEQWSVFFAIIAYQGFVLQSYPTYWILRVEWKKGVPGFRNAFVNQLIILKFLENMVYDAIFDRFFGVHPVIPV